jgi:cytochrome c oxidase assembly protein subunit 15
LGTLALASTRAAPSFRRAGLAVGFFLLLQVGLGIGTVLAGAPLPLAAAHNAGAALLLLGVLTLNHRLARGGPIAGERP